MQRDQDDALPALPIGVATAATQKPIIPPKVIIQYQTSLSSKLCHFDAVPNRLFIYSSLSHLLIKGVTTRYQPLVQRKCSMSNPMRIATGRQHSPNGVLGPSRLCYQT
jgi:hypothetical protein